ncbi:PTB domain-containing engulfment adapter protein 1-like isoform X1 [Petromyzon marinus]|uniref:PTB domain-containing engulfment adapter protein 1 n=1 Tax=Petromyzon marinus TaxID=7757 RepID=A0AAJ7TD61_PETMA|nr:PTB domain-containing engulfment adapter protein 1-like isoform X1 [Petromyzon marinus]XP_032814704.1 PTB domain-containing engulfment adapter protein 1-like isoform X1 [Petromyzon marinus]XP_032814713.1 PTB domain-containing engulfment adapter protein 1-like isoform X1 [Petromyzon marinus]XP_032814721.1 PTB domain-containing engulfment adapter protein 1-like isoform X1 [Petromyzon marinus]
MPRPFNKRKDKIWIHPPEVLILGSVLYTVKFLGSREVDQPKGSDIVKDAVNKLKFTRHIKKAEGQKLQKVELHISVHIVRIVQQKSKELLHSIPLNHISFCADDKVDKRMLAFVCRDVDKNRNLCYAFDSDKCAKEIALTIGQAFEVAYRQYVDSGARDAEFRKQMASLCQRVVNLETENGQLKKQVQELKDMFKSTQDTKSQEEVCHLQSGLERSVETKRPNSLLLQPCLTLPNTELSTLFVPPTGSKSPDSGVTDIFDMEPFSPLFGATDLQPESDESEAESLSPRSVKAEHDSPVSTTSTAPDDNTGSLSETANGPVFISQFCLPDRGFQFSNLHTGSKWMSMDSQCLTLLRHHWG